MPIARSYSRATDAAGKWPGASDEKRGGKPSDFPKFSGDAKFVRLLDGATDIVTNDFTQDFIDHSGTVLLRR